jgi:DNA-binding NarL/FixJ family response regulator
MTAPAEKDRSQTSPKMIRIVIVDDHPIVREGLTMLIRREPDMVVAGEADNALDALSIVETEDPDIVIVDLSLRDSDGLELIKQLQSAAPKLPTLVLSMRDEGIYAERSLRAGARGYVAKEEGPAKVIEGVRKVLAGQVFVSAQIAAKVMQKFAGGAGTSEEPSVSSLTDRELQIFQLIGQGLPTREIAQQLHISPKTVDSHREHIKRKLQLDTANDLARHAIQWVQCQKNI